MGIRSRSVKRPVIATELADRLPPGQIAAKRWPVLHVGEIPAFDPTTWDFQIFGLVDQPLRFTWNEFQRLPRTSVAGDLHCVTRWSVLDATWQGVAASQLIGQAGVRREAHYVVLHGENGYTANLPLSAIVASDAILALMHDGEPLTPAHGFPVRAVIPQRYAWKSVKWLRAIELLATDRSGYWESYGYHANGDSWREERFAEEPAAAAREEERGGR